MSTITLKINGKSCRAESGQTILEVARHHDVDIPTLCYHPKLSIVGACRMCVVEVTGSRGLVTACSTQAADNMEIFTHSDKVVASRKNVLDLLLSDHPMECLTCEAGGSCKLQKYAYEYGVDGSTYRVPARDFPKDTANPFFVRDMSLCISCGLCVRACDEVVGASALGFSHRGDRTYVGPAFGHKITDTTCVSCGNCVTVCPTGALTVKAARNRRRTANIKRIKTTCSYCGVGCQMELLVDKGEVIGVEPVDSAPNEGFLCVKGRFGFDFIHHPDRLTTPLVRRDGELVQATWEEALNLVTEKLGAIKAEHGADSLAALSSARCTNEENYLMQKLFRAVIGTNNVDHCARL